MCVCVHVATHINVSVCLLSLDKNDQAGGSETYF